MELDGEFDEKKRTKLSKKINADVGMVAEYLKDLKKLNIDASDLYNHLTETECNIMDYVFPNSNLEKSVVE